MLRIILIHEVTEKEMDKLNVNNLKSIQFKFTLIKSGSEMFIFQ